MASALDERANYSAAKKQAPCIVFSDEIGGAVGSQRSPEESCQSTLPMAQNQLWTRNGWVRVVRCQR